MAKWEMAAKRAPAERSRNDWCTPQETADLIHEFYGGSFDLDPCGSWESVLKAQYVYFLENDDDGLLNPWIGRCYVNPPFDEVRKWAAKAVEEHRRLAEEIIFLMAARTDTRAWHQHIATAAAVCFWRGRMTFIGAPDPCPFPLALAYWGRRVERFELIFGRVGMVVRLPLLDPFL